MHNYPLLVSGALQLLFRHFSQRQEVLQAFQQVNYCLLLNAERFSVIFLSFYIIKIYHTRWLCFIIVLFSIVFPLFLPTPMSWPLSGGIKVKGQPKPWSPTGFLDPQPITSQNCKTTNMRSVHCIVCLFASHLLPVQYYTTWWQSNRMRETRLRFCTLGIQRWEFNMHEHERKVNALPLCHRATPNGGKCPNMKCSLSQSWFVIADRSSCWSPTVTSKITNR